jgi:hypothetical protein
MAQHHKELDVCLPGHQWGLLLPVCYRGKEDKEAVWERLHEFIQSLKATTTPEERSLLRVHVAIDQASASRQQRAGLVVYSQACTCRKIALADT